MDAKKKRGGGSRKKGGQMIENIWNIIKNIK